MVDRQPRLPAELDRILRPLRPIGWWLRDLFDFVWPPPLGPTISSIDPTQGHAGTRVIIQGARFATQPADNLVSFNGTPARVLSATDTEISAIVETGTDSGPVTVEVAGDTATGPGFTILGYPRAGAGEDGPPICYAGTGAPGASGSVSPTGTRLEHSLLPGEHDRTRRVSYRVLGAESAMHIGLKPQYSAAASIIEVY